MNKYIIYMLYFPRATLAFPPLTAAPKKTHIAIELQELVLSSKNLRHSREGGNPHSEAIPWDNHGSPLSRG